MAKRTEQPKKLSSDALRKHLNRTLFETDAQRLARLQRDKVGHQNQRERDNEPGWFPLNSPAVFGREDVTVMVGDLQSDIADGILRPTPTYRMLKAEEIGALLRYYIMMRPQHHHRVALLNPRFSILRLQNSSLSAQGHIEVNANQFTELIMPVFHPAGGTVGSWSFGRYMRGTRVIEAYNPLQPIHARKQVPVNQTTAELMKHVVRTALPQGATPSDLFVKPVHYAWYDRNSAADTSGDAIVLLAMLLLHRDEKRISKQTRYPTEPNQLRQLFGKIINTLLAGSVPALEFPQLQILRPLPTQTPTPRLVPTKAAIKQVKAGIAVSRPAMCWQGCASRSVKHQVVEEYSSGGFERDCPFCKAKLLKSEYEAITRGQRVSKCCSNGAVHTKFMQARYDELINPPDFMKIVHDEPRLRKYVDAHWKHLNAAYQMVSVTSHEDPTPLPRGIPCMRVNLDFAYGVGDLHSSKDPTTGRPVQPKFAQVYTYDPEEAERIRQRAFDSLAQRMAEKKKAPKVDPVESSVRRQFDKMLRECNPCVQSILTTEERIAKWQKEHPDAASKLPKFRLIMLSNREAEAAKVRDPKVHLHRSEGASANNIAAIWVDDEGEPPKLAGVYFEDRQGRLQRLHYYDRNIDPLCYPLLFPYGTQGYQYGISNADAERVLEGKQLKAEEQRLEKELNELQSVVDVQIKQGADSEFIEGREDLDEDIADDGGAEGEGEVEEEDTCIAGAKTRARGKAKFISHRQHTRYLMQFRGKRPMSYHWLWSKRKLSEVYTLDVCQRIERHEMDEAKKAQNHRVSLSSGLVEALQRKILTIDPNARLGKVYMQSVNTKGSRAYMQKAYADAMAMVRQLGNPHLFITFTGNPEWPEIKAFVDKEKGQTYIDQPMIVTRVFIDKANAFLDDLTKKQVIGKVAGYVVATEHQKRGMPHLHCLLILEKPKLAIPTNATEAQKVEAQRKFEAERDYFGSSQQVNDLIQAEIEPEPHPDDPLFEFRSKVREYCTKHMLHDCFNDSPCRVDGRCTKGFPKQYVEQTIVSDDNMPQYRRRCPNPDGSPVEVADDAADGEVDEEGIAAPDYQRRAPASANTKLPESRYGELIVKKIRGKGLVEIDNSRVVPFNPFLLVKYNCHINVEWVYGEKCVNYLMKYIMKGHDLAYVKVSSENDSNPVIDYNEFEYIRKVRYMTSIEAYMRIHGYPIIQKSHTVIPLFVHGPDRSVVYRDGANEEEIKLAMQKADKSKLMAFFKLCQRKDDAGALARRLTYVEMPRLFWYKDGAWKIREKGENRHLIVRLAAVNSRDPQLVAIRLLLMHVRGPKSFNDLKTLADGTRCANFVEAAEKRGLLDSNESFIQTLKDASDEMTSRTRFRRFFASLIVNLPPPIPEKVFDELMDSLKLPPAKGTETAMQKEQRKQCILNSLEYILRQMSQTCAKVGLPEPLHYSEAEVEEVALMEREILLSHVGDDEDVKRSNNPWKVVYERNYRSLKTEQKAAFERIKGAVESKSKAGHRQFFVEGAGGTGKTFLYNTLIAWAKANNKTFRACASTGIASTLLISGATAHSTFWVPVNLKSDTPSRMDAEKYYAESLRGAELIIIDEISMLHRDVLYYIDRALKDIAPVEKRELPFGGKVVVLGGDWKQLMPVVKGQGEYGAVAASIKFTSLFDQFETLKLTHNMRLDADAIEFAEWLSKVGRGENFIASEYIAIHKENMVKDKRQMIDFVYKWKSFDKPLDNAVTFIKNAILCPKLSSVHRANEIMLDRIPGKAQSLLSRDYVTQEPADVLGIDVADRHAENLHRQRPDGFPPHGLRLKSGAIVVLLRNLDIPMGLCNGTRLQVVSIHNSYLRCRVLKGSGNVESIHLIPRSKFQYGQKDDERGLQWIREQFPVQLAFAMTINKAQGQTLERMGLVLETQAFSHGQIYTALSRVRRSSAFRVLTCGSAPEPNWIVNRVYPAMVESELPQKPTPTAMAAEDTCDDGGDATAASTEPSIPAFTPITDAEPDIEEEGREEDADVGPLYLEAPEPDARRVREQHCPYPKLALRNSGSDCFLNGMLQMLRFSPAARQYLRDYAGRDALFMHMADIIRMEGSCASVGALRARLKPGLFDYREDLRTGHQDATEFLDSYLFRDAQLGSTADEERFYRLFRFSTREELTCLNGACPKQVIRAGSTPNYILTVNLDPRRRREQDFPSLIRRLQEPETISRRCSACGCERAKKRTMYDFSSTTHLLLRFAVFDSQLRKRDVDFSGHQLDGQEMFGSEWNALSILIHHGDSITAGHYWTECRALDGEWWRFEDAKEPKSLRPNVLLSGAYCVLYAKGTPSAALAAPLFSPRASAAPTAPHVSPRVSATESIKLSDSFISKTGGISLGSFAGHKHLKDGSPTPTARRVPTDPSAELRGIWASVGHPDDVIKVVGNVKLLRSDFARLRNGEWFSDNIVDAYSYLWSNAVSGPLFRVAYLSAYFYDLLSKKRPLSEEMQRWICKIDIKLLDLFFLPIHTPNHYSLVLIHPKMHTIAYCDSMPGLADPQTILRDVVTFISPQFPNEKWDRWNISALKYPQQTNGFDCAVFTCAGIRAACLQNKLDFNQSQMERYRKKIACELVEGKVNRSVV